MRITRRHFLDGGLVALAMTALPGSAASPFQALASRSAAAGATPESVPLWPGPPPGGGGPQGPCQLSARGSLTAVSQPALTVYRPSAPNGAAMLVAAGGGYRHIEMGKEALPAVAWLAGLGITAFVLSYRLPGEGWNAGRLAPFQDAQRALRLIRARCAAFDVDPHRVGVLGFSAGGHLLGIAATRPDWRSAPARDRVDLQAARSDLNLLIYPIVTLEKPYQHTSTCKTLLAGDTSARAAAEWSVQSHVRSTDAPFLLVQAADDPISDPANTALLQQACLQHAVPVERYLFPTGGHGFGMGRLGGPTRAWPAMATRWMQSQSFI